ncbi:glycogen debranching protein GlgX [Chitinasiproducens palmae]|uniref:Glycogen operon protein n=1 Tax=Chitinasiproducens palmae TaxID=1770053 RepID=A0A1H2PP56_9BURK|nr:glycogen debranching protein GlgX [Chitinasiproducens palmae]SDV47654.1 glycogen operon protein [Chitinasiproducens palmae]
MRHWPPDRLAAGLPYPLGATWDGLGCNFAVFSAHAERIEVCLFDPAGRREVARLALPECTDDVWHGYLPGAQPGQLYGLRAYGPYQPHAGHRFNPHKLLLDPYARQLAGRLRWSDALYAFRPTSSRADLSFDRRDSAPAMPKAVIVDPARPDTGDRPPGHAWQDTVIYEAHVRGASMLRRDLLPPLRGTFAALADPVQIDHLHRLGVTAIELLPVQAFAQDRFLVQRGLGNYWGYSTLSYFAPEPRYIADQAGHHAADEFRLAVRRFHAAGIEVILDVVYNHTCESNELGPTLSWRGLDNASYYRLLPGEPRHYENVTGCGNTLNLSHPRVLQMVMDSLRHWALVYGIDGFRFDLGSTLGREAHGFDPGAGFFDAIRQDPVLATRKLISEPWDIGPGGYQLGEHPSGFAEWNDRFRDGARRLWRGDPYARQEFAARLSGSADLFGRPHRRAWASVNFVACHDGFPLADLVAYAHKHNDANGEDGRDGHDDNASSNWVPPAGNDPAHDGPSDDPAVNETRARVARALVAMPFLSLGTPMILAGDEFGHSQRGNNNAYCQDNPISWLDWQQARGEAARTMTDFVARLTALRRAYPLLRRDRFLSGTETWLPGVHDVDWFDPGGTPLTPAAWQDPTQRAFQCRRAGESRTGGVDVLTLLCNPEPVPLPFRLPEPTLRWRKVLDSAAPGEPSGPVDGTTVSVAAHSVVVVAAVARDGAHRHGHAAPLAPSSASSDAS